MGNISVTRYHSTKENDKNYRDFGKIYNEDPFYSTFVNLLLEVYTYMMMKEEGHRMSLNYIYFERVLLKKRKIFIFHHLVKRFLQMVSVKCNSRLAMPLCGSVRI